MPNNQRVIYQKIKFAVLVLVLCILADMPLYSKDASKSKKESPLKKSVLSAKPGFQSMPANGQSQFELWFERQTQKSAKFTIPFPFSKLVHALSQEIDAFSEQAFNNVGLFFPYGRSLQRFAAKPDYFTYPRTVVAFFGSPKQHQNNIGIDLSSKTYLGYVEPSKQIEIISFNPFVGRFEFLVVDDYAEGKTPQLKYANRSICLACHHNEAPIFAAEPWSESNDNEAIAKMIMKARRSKTYLGFPISIPNMPDRLFSKQALVFDNMVHQSNRLRSHSLMRQTTCPAELPQRKQCRVTMIKATLMNILQIPIAYDEAVIKKHDTIAKSIYGKYDKLEYRNLGIPDRDPLTNDEVDGHNAVVIQNSKAYTDATLATLEKNITALPDKLNPLVFEPRHKPFHLSKCTLPLEGKNLKRSWCLTSSFKALFNKDQLESLNAAALDNANETSAKQAWDLYQKYSKAIDRLASDTDFFDWPYIDDYRFSYNLKRILNDLPPAQEQIPASKISEKTSQEKRASAKNTDSTEDLLRRYCGNCHSDKNLTYPIQFLAGNTAAEVLLNINSNREIIKQCIEGSEKFPMPPPYSIEFTMMKNEGRTINDLLEALQR